MKALVWDPKSGRRKCGTHGCNLVDFHPGPHSNELLDQGKRSRTTVHAPPPKKKPRVKAAPPRRKPLQVPVVQRGTVPAEQRTRPDGTSLYYHATRWGVPLPDGPVALEPCSEDEVDEGWRLSETSARIASRPDVTQAERALAVLWNAHVALLPPLVSDRMVPDACRRFARAHCERLCGELRVPFLSHLLLLSKHNLLHRDDVHDCLLLARLPPPPEPKQDQARQRRGAKVAVGDQNDVAASPTADGPSPSSVQLCGSCSRPIHDTRCALHGRPRGVATWQAANQCG